MYINRDLLHALEAQLMEITVILILLTYFNYILIDKTSEMCHL